MIMESLPKMVGATSGASNVHEQQHLNKLLLYYFILSELATKCSASARPEGAKDLPENHLMSYKDPRHY